MLRGKTILTTIAVLGVCAVPASAQEYQDLRSADAKDAAAHRGLYESDGGSYTLNRNFGSPDRLDAARDLPSGTAAGPFTDSDRKLVESPEVQAMVDRISAEIAETPQVVEVSGTSSGFDWGDAAIGAAGMLALFSITAGSALLLTGRRRRGGFRVATH
jgi:hypothetical protein